MKSKYDGVRKYSFNKNCLPLQCYQNLLWMEYFQAMAFINSLSVYVLFHLKHTFFYFSIPIISQSGVLTLGGHFPF